MNLAELITGVTRTVTTQGSHHTVQLEHIYEASPEEIWDAITQPQRLEKWFEPTEGELIEGGRYQLTESDTEGTIQRCDRPRSVNITWEYDGDESAVQVTLQPLEGGTHLTIRHTMEENDHWRTYGPAATGIGWESSLVSLALHLNAASSDILQDLCNFAGSTEGHTYTDDAADAWKTAYVQSGADENQAQQQAIKTAAFYKGTE